MKVIFQFMAPQDSPLSTEITDWLIEKQYNVGKICWLY